MHDLNNKLLAARIGIVPAHHLEAGPETHPYLHVGLFEIEIQSSCETSLSEIASNSTASHVHNILAFRQRKLSAR
jgi:hypothetical protein